MKTFINTILGKETLPNLKYQIYMTSQIRTNSQNFTSLTHNKASNRRIWSQKNWTHVWNLQSWLQKKIIWWWAVSLENGRTMKFRQCPPQFLTPICIHNMMALGLKGWTLLDPPCNRQQIREYFQTSPLGLCHQNIIEAKKGKTLIYSQHHRPPQTKLKQKVREELRVHDIIGSKNIWEFRMRCYERWKNL